MVNIYDADFDDVRDREGFRARRARLTRQAGGGDLVGVSLWEVPPGETAYPYHWHLAQEEVVVVLEGRPHLRTPAGWRQVEKGEVLAFAPSEEGAHQISNATDETVRFLAVANQQPDIIMYPDSGKVMASQKGRGLGVHHAFHIDDQVSPWDGETPPEVPS
jgi:uncharacterized cupin superfamily protein